MKSDPTIEELIESTPTNEATDDLFADTDKMSKESNTTDENERESIRECPECGEEGHQGWVLGHWHCSDCDLTYTDSGNTDVTQI